MPVAAWTCQRQNPEFLCAAVLPNENVFDMPAQPTKHSRNKVLQCFRVFSTANAQSKVNIAIMRAFVRLRAMLATHADLARRLNELEQKYDDQFRVVFEAIRELMTPEPVPPSRRIGFTGKHVRDTKY